MVAGLSLMALYAVAAVSVFLIVLSIVALYYVLQIAEDLRYIRSKSDIHVQRPRKTSNVLAICIVASCVVSFVVLGFLLTMGASIR